VLVQSYIGKNCKFDENTRIMLLRTLKRNLRNVSIRSADMIVHVTCDFVENLSKYWLKFAFFYLNENLRHRSYLNLILFLESCFLLLKINLQFFRQDFWR